MLTLSIQQPWAWLIVNGYKDVENRSWGTPYRGKVLIHASKRRITRHEETYFTNLCVKHGVPRPWEDMLYGGIVGIAEITDCVRFNEAAKKGLTSPWFVQQPGNVGWVLKNAQPLPFLACKGSLGLFEIEYPEESEMTR